MVLETARQRENLVMLVVAVMTVAFWVAFIIAQPGSGEALWSGLFGVAGVVCLGVLVMRWVNDGSNPQRRY